MYGYLYDGTQDVPPQQRDKNVPLDAIDVGNNQSISGGGQYVPPPPEVYGHLYDLTKFTIPVQPGYTVPQDAIEVYNSITISGGNPPTFTLSAASISLVINQGSNQNDTLTTVALYGFNNNVTLSAAGQPSGVTISFGTNPITAPGSGTSVMNVAVAGSVAVGYYSFIVTAVGG